jgi:transcriptional regulator
MYIPKAFRKDDIKALHTLMQEDSFATLVTCQDGVPFATHLPLLLDTKRGPYGTLRGHIARGNPQWRSFNGMGEALIIFQGPHAYITPSWYEVELSVPTWNYAVAHAYGIPRVIEDKTALYALLQDLVQTHEAHFEKPWQFQLPDDYVQKMMQGVVGFEMEITRLEGKYKLSQNRSINEQRHVAATLEAQGDDLSVGVAALMKENIVQPH